MAITEENRHRLFQRCEQVLGKDETATLMELLPPVGWADVATKRDLDHQRVALSADIDAMGSALRLELRDLGSELRSEMSDLRSEMDGLRGEIRALGSDLRAEMYREQRNHTLAMIGANSAIAAVVVAALQIL